jgi:uncharacterized protein Yka (UPF0111/DUF47 family)
LPLTDIITGYGDAISEVIVLILLVLGFFRWYDSKYAKIVKEQREISDSNASVIKNTLCGQIERIESDLDHVQETLTRHLDRRNGSPVT